MNEYITTLNSFSEFPFFDLTELLYDFFEKNGLPEPTNTANTSKGIIATGDNYLFILHSELIEDGNRLFPYIGGKGAYSQIINRYSLEGKINEEEIKLVAEAVETQHYSLEKIPGHPCFAPQPVKRGEPEREIKRLDDYPYWFLTEPL